MRVPVNLQTGDPIRLTCITAEPIPTSAEDSLSLRSIKHLSAGITFELSSWLELVSSPMPTISSPSVWSPPCLVWCTGTMRRTSLEPSPQPQIPPSRYVPGVLSKFARHFSSINLGRNLRWNCFGTGRLRFSRRYRWAEEDVRTRTNDHHLRNSRSSSLFGFSFHVNCWSYHLLACNYGYCK